jgi:hypothetical protein
MILRFFRALFARKLHVYANDYDMVVARNLDEAKRLWSETTGGIVPVDDEDWHQVADDYAFSIWCNAEGAPDEPGDGAKLITLTAAEWAANMGAGFLCSSEY